MEKNFLTEIDLPPIFSVQTFVEKFKLLVLRILSARAKKIDVTNEKFFGMEAEFKIMCETFQQQKKINFTIENADPPKIFKINFCNFVRVETVFQFSDGEKKLLFFPIGNKIFNFETGEEIIDFAKIKIQNKKKY